MKKSDFIKCMNLHKKLKSRIKGRIFITINDDTMLININGIKGIKYRSFINDINRDIDVEDIANGIIYDYRKFIISKFIITGGEQ